MKDRTDQEPTSRPWAWRLGSLAGIPIYLHATFVLLLAWIASSHISAGHGLALAGQGLVLIAVFEHDELVGLLDPEPIDELLARRGVRPGGFA